MSTFGPPPFPPQLSRFDRFVTLRFTGDSQDARGVPTRTAGTTLANVPCRIAATSSTEGFEVQMRVQTRVFDAVFPRWTAGGTEIVIGPNDEVEDGATVYRVDGGAIVDPAQTGTQRAVLVRRD